MKGKVLLRETLRNAERSLTVATQAISGLLPRVRLDETIAADSMLISGAGLDSRFADGELLDEELDAHDENARQSAPAPVRKSSVVPEPIERVPLPTVESAARFGVESVRPPPIADQSADAWSKCTSNYDVFADAVTRPFAEDAIQLVRMRPGARVLDVAAGTGSFALAAARRSAQVLATDFSPAMIERLDHKCRAMRIGNVRTAVMDGQALEVEDGTFDVAGSLFGLMFFPDHDQGLRELVRVLRPGGQAVVAVWAPPPRVDLMGLLGEAAMAAMCDPPNSSARPHWAPLMDATKLAARLKSAGFAHAHVVVVRHMWAFDSAEYLAELLPAMTPAYAELVALMPSNQRASFFDALTYALKQRQGEGPFALTSEGLIAVGTKAG